MNIQISTGAVLCVVTATAQANVMTFEGLAPAGGEVAPAAPYVEDGLRLTAESANNGIFSVSHGVNTAGFASDFFTWDFNMTAPQLTLTEINGELFELKSLEIGDSGTDGPIVGTDVRITGFYFGGGSISMEYLNVTAATLVSPVGFENLSSLTIMSAKGDAGIDNIMINVVPAPGALTLLGLALMGRSASRRRRSA